jgi:pyridoxal phosphate enzyme (YggS family)
MAITDKLASVQQRLTDACRRSGRDSNAVTLLAVSKGMPPEMVREAEEAGLSLMGENKVQEARAKIPLCSSRLRWHLIGHLQSNKCRDAVRLFEMIQSVDSLSLAQELNRCADKQSRTMPILLEVNMAGESSKFGFDPDQVLAELKEINSLPRLEIHGLMTIAPWTTETHKLRPIFTGLRELKTRCEDRLGAPLPHLSMGMSGDFEIAIEEGATIVRIGTALFGPRPQRRASQV